ncbi:MAG TPA: RecX family transcriptional regulator [Mobilitalea sp.]|nr:RecX family transcriptional regulator [Mobilitalea sp.]
MVITDILEADTGQCSKKKAYKIFVDDTYAFLLYENELKQLQLSKGAEISDNIYEAILEDIIFKRAKHKALNILKYSDKTEKEIYFRLKDEYHNDDIIERTIEYLKNYNYINDERYALNYIRSRKDKESKIAIESKLLSKGINKKVLEKIIAKEYEISDEDNDPEILAIKKIIAKKCENTTSLSCEEKMRLINMLKRKGFNSEKINKCM